MDPKDEIVFEILTPEVKAKIDKAIEEWAESLKGVQLAADQLSYTFRRMEERFPFPRIRCELAGAREDGEDSAHPGDE